MLKIFDNSNDFFNNLVKTNTENPSWISNKNKNSIPISNKYYLNILDEKNLDVKNFYDYIDDSTRSLKYPFKIEKNIDYSFMIEIEQIYKIDIEQSNLKKISNDLDIFFDIVNESNGEIILILDIFYLINNFIDSKQIYSNHLVDFILWKLKKKLSCIYILDCNLIIKNHKNMLFVQLESCLINFDKFKYNLNYDFSVYKNINDDLIKNVYWNLLYFEMGKSIEKSINKNTDENTNKIKSPYDSTYFDLVTINGNKCFLGKVNLIDVIDNNLLDLNSNQNYGIIIDPSDRINIIFADIN